jgi:hypothetical protein
LEIQIIILKYNNPNQSINVLKISDNHFHK